MSLNYQILNFLLYEMYRWCLNIYVAVSYQSWLTFQCLPQEEVAVCTGKINPSCKPFHVLHNCNMFLVKKAILTIFDSELYVMFPVVFFHINWLLPKCSDLTLENDEFPLCRRHRKKLFKTKSVLMFEHGASLQKGKETLTLKHFVGFLCVKVESRNNGTTVEVVKKKCFLLKQRCYVCRVKHSR